MLGFPPRRFRRAADDLLELRGPIAEAVAVVADYIDRGQAYWIEVRPRHLLGVLAAVETGTLTPDQARTWAATLEPITRYAGTPLLPRFPPTITNRTRAHIVLRHLAETTPLWLDLDTYGITALRAILTTKDSGEVCRVLCETLIDPDNALTYTWQAEGVDFAVYPVGEVEDGEFVFARLPPPASGYAMPQTIATGTLAGAGMVLDYTIGGFLLDTEADREALAAHHHAMITHLTGPRST
ncbi:hypothetical protein [Glycomyces sp. NPDC047010]|uniref:hypothetical protein n=1 Tax=Glycomyces sp. NPDC047010 TaxID=3155023 RepID=UPI0033D7A304